MGVGRPVGVDIAEAAPQFPGGVGYRNPSQGTVDLDFSFS
jgi:hypothetical protein